MFACRAKDVRFQTVEILISKGKATTIPPPIPVKFNNSRIQERSLSSVRAVALEKGEGGGKKNMEKKKKEKKDEKKEREERRKKYRRCTYGEINAFFLRNEQDTPVFEG